MQLACDLVVSNQGCDYVAHGDTADQVRDAMMAHGATTHANLTEGMSTDELEEAKAGMAGHIEQLIVEHN